MANAIYNSFKRDVSTIDWEDNATTTIKAMLVLDTYIPNIDTHTVKSNITGEVTGTGYTDGGAVVVGRAISIDTVADYAKWDATDVTWGTATITARGVVVYKDTGDPATSPLICYIDFTEDKVSDAGDFIVQWHPDGVVKVA